MNYYSRAIDILYSVSDDTEQEHAPLKEIAKQTPSVIVKASNHLGFIAELSEHTDDDLFFLELAKDK